MLQMWNRITNNLCTCLRYSLTHNITLNQNNPLYLFHCFKAICLKLTRKILHSYHAICHATGVSANISHSCMVIIPYKGLHSFVCMGHSIAGVQCFSSEFLELKSKNPSRDFPDINHYARFFNCILCETISQCLNIFNNTGTLTSIQ